MTNPFFQGGDGTSANHPDANNVYDDAPISPFGTVDEVRKSKIIAPHFHTRRQDLADLRDRILALLYERSGTISVAEAVGILEIAKMELFQEQSNDA